MLNLAEAEFEIEKTQQIRSEHENNLKRDPAIELARLLGCLIVIGCHTYLQPGTDGVYDFSRLLIAMFLADGVAVFWLIGGAFLFDNSDYKRLVIRSFRKVFLPMLLVGVIYFYYASYQAGNTTLSALVFNYGNGYKDVLLNLLKWRNGIQSYGHTWYVYVYMLLMISYPALKGVVTYADAHENRIKILICGIMAFLALNDFSHNQLASFSHYSINGLAAASLISFVGYYIYKAREKFRGRCWLIISPAFFIITNIVRAIIQVHRGATGSGSDKSIMYWYSVTGVIAAACILIFCLALIQTRKATRLNRAICFFASYTFPIYLIHYLVRNIYDHFGLRDALKRSLLGWNDGIPGELIYTLLIIAIVFFSSFVIVFTFQTVKNKTGISQIIKKYLCDR